MHPSRCHRQDLNLWLFRSRNHGVPQVSHRSLIISLIVNNLSIYSLILLLLSVMSQLSLCRRSMETLYNCMVLAPSMRSSVTGAYKPLELSPPSASTSSTSLTSLVFFRRYESDFPMYRSVSVSVSMYRSVSVLFSVASVLNVSVHFCLKIVLLNYTPRIKY